MSQSLAADDKELEVAIECVEELVEPDPKSMAAYSDVQPVGQISERDVPIFARRGAMKQVREAAEVSIKVDAEVGGFLIGNAFQDPDTERLFVEISEVVEADKATGTYASLNFGYNVWREVLDRIDSDFLGKFVMGWYHTHLISQAVVLPVKGTEDEFAARYSPFLSQQDEFLHRNFFPDPWHVALVIDLRCQRDTFFAWYEGEIIATQGFYLYGE